MRMNGHHGPVPGPDHTSILVAIASRLGRVEQKVDDLARRIDARRVPLSDWVTLGMCSLALGALAAGKITWAEALPTVLGIVGR